jgi:GTP-binding protein
MLFCSARRGTVSVSPEVEGPDLRALFETIVEYIPAPEQDTEQPLQMLVSSIDYNDYVGRIAIGRIQRGVIKQNQEIAVCNYLDSNLLRKAKVVSLYVFDGLSKQPVSESAAGDIIALSGVSDINIGDTICAPGSLEPCPLFRYPLQP